MDGFDQASVCRRGRTFAGAMSLAAAALTLALAACAPSTDRSATIGQTGEWLEFEGSWNATGSRRVLALGTDRQAAIFDLRGSLLLSGAGRPGAGFRSDLIALSDTTVGLQGRSVWTDERGDQVFSELTGEGTRADNHMRGTILGGTGRYAGASGTYEFSWHSLFVSEDGHSIQGRAQGLKGRVRVGGSNEGSSK